MSERKKIYYYLKEIPNAIYKAEIIDGELYDLLPDKHKEFFSLKKPNNLYEQIQETIANMQFGTTTVNAVPHPISTNELLISALIENYVNDLIPILIPQNSVSTGIQPIMTTSLPNLRYAEISGIFTVTLNGYRWSIDELEDYIVDNLLTDTPSPDQQVFFVGTDEQD